MLMEFATRQLDLLRIAPCGKESGQLSSDPARFQGCLRDRRSVATVRLPDAGTALPSAHTQPENETRAAKRAAAGCSAVLFERGRYLSMMGFSTLGGYQLLPTASRWEVRSALQPSRNMAMRVSLPLKIGPNNRPPFSIMKALDYGAILVRSGANARPSHAPAQPTMDRRRPRCPTTHFPRT